MTIFFAFVAASCFIWVIILLLPWQPWGTRESWDPSTITKGEPDLGDVTVLIPARNEAEVIGRTVSAVVQQSKKAHILIIDDNSDDQTAQQALAAGGDNISIIQGAERPPGWSGKLWALEQGRKSAQTDTIMLLDADIELRPGVIADLYQRLQNSPFSFLSLMAAPALNGFWDTLLMPAFIYFFKLLYPFKLANSKYKWISAAAGGCIMMKKEILDDMGGFGAIKDELIDDCMLARKAKNLGYRTWLGLTHAAKSNRPYNGFAELWNMVARTAYTQLHYSISLLLVCTVLMILVYWLPIAGLIIFGGYFLIAPACALLTMMITFVPILRYYGLNAAWALIFPITATLFLAMTWTSAIRYWRGERMRWRGRVVTAKL